MIDLSALSEHFINKRLLMLANSKLNMLVKSFKIECMNSTQLKSVFDDMKIM